MAHSGKCDERRGVIIFFLRKKSLEAAGGF